MKGDQNVSIIGLNIVKAKTWVLLNRSQWISTSGSFVLGHLNVCLCLFAFLAPPFQLPLQLILAFFAAFSLQLVLLLKFNQLLKS